MRIAAVALTLTMSVTVAAGAGAQEAAAVNRQDYLTEYRLPGPPRGPLGVAVDAGGQVWFTTSRTGSLGMLDPQSGRVRDYPLAPGGRPLSVIAGAAGDIWLTEYDWSAQPAREGLWHFNQADAQFRAVRLPTAPAGPLLLMQDRNGATWVSEYLSGKVARVQGDAVREYTILSPAPGQKGAGLAGLAEDPQGRIWVALSHREQLARLDPASGQVELFPAPAEFWSPTGLAGDPQGRIYAGSHAGSRLAAIDAVTGQVVAEYETFPPPPEPPGLAGTRPTGLVAGAAGDIWFAEHDGNRIGRVLPFAATVVEYRLPGTAAAAQWLARDAVGGIWYAAENQNVIGRVDAAAPYVTVRPAAPPPFIPAGATYLGYLRLEAVGAPRRVKLVAADQERGPRVQVVFDVPEVDLQPGQVQTVRYQLTVPAGVRPGDYYVLLGADAGDFLASVRLPYTAVRSRAWWPWVMLGLGPVLLAAFLLAYRRQRRQ